VVDEGKKLGTASQPEVRAGQVVHCIDPSAPGGVEGVLVKVFKGATKERVRIQIIVESKA
jgi:hypothetical protein